jgi:hypothetical protein
MIRKYSIKEVTTDWLLMPGTLVYIEREYNELVNRYIKEHLDEIQRDCQRKGVVFLYIPKFYSSFPAEILKYYTGKKMSYPSKIYTYDILNSILSNIELSQIDEPSILFTGSGEEECVTYAIGKDNSFWGKFFTSKRESYIKNSIGQILSDIDMVYDNVKREHYYNPDTITGGGQLFTDEPHETADFRLKFEKKRKPKPSREFVIEEESCKESSIDTRFRISKMIEDDGPDADRGTKHDVKEEDDIILSDACIQAQQFVARLLIKGYSYETIWSLLAPMKELSPIKVTRDLRILLTAYNLEIELPPVQKAVYLLFLKHPEGINFKDMPDHQEELFRLYRKVAVRGEREKHLATITDLVNPFNNSMNEKCSIIKKRILTLLDDELALHYYISGGKGETKKIDINPSMIEWEG